jgi:phage-related protein
MRICQYGTDRQHHHHRLCGASFNSRKELMAHIDAFIAAYHADAKPFVWTKSEVHQKCLKPCVWIGVSG